ncbi:amino acid adenylation domain-containing protein [Paenibacillus vini]|uniref:non-ribosomal peptide synthetase n=1 Tax=Paenibacillus vini TaxID=1476024 RepID=UPI0025B688EE|nr:non-ribosomal peptide synthetase [Paenibacillus vini]MDN4066700.1 amino acid adenylation domain-containing protein [Paenibacillus vini]
MEILIGDAYRNRLTEIKKFLLSNSLVHDVVLLQRKIQSQIPCLVAYIVPVINITPAKIQQSLLEQFHNCELPSAYVCVSAIPLTSRGEVDEEKLFQWEVHSEELIKNWELHLKELDVIQDAVIIEEPINELSVSLHMEDLVRDWPLSQMMSTSESVFVEPTITDYANKPLAYQNGGTLEIGPDQTLTLTSALLITVAKYPDKGITFIQYDGKREHLSYATLLESARKILSGLQKSGMKPGDKAILQIRDLREHFSTFWACLLGGIIPVTVAVAQTYQEKNSVLVKLFQAWTLLEGPVFLTGTGMKDDLVAIGKLMQMDGVDILSYEELYKHAPSVDLHDSMPTDVAFFQLSSGSTGVPKCIQEVHGNLVRHIHASAQFNGFSPQDRTLNWLPLDHVVPVITYHLKDVYLGCDQLLVHTEYILNEPLRWFDLIERHGISHTWSPNFAFQLVNMRLVNELREWDLSSIKFFMNAGEQVTLTVAKTFLKHVIRFGASANSMQPAFGMAESCTCITYENGFEPDQSQRFVSLGHVVAGMEICIANDDGKVLYEGQIGRLQLRGQMVTPGYYRNDEANLKAFVQDGWFDTGDQGFILDGKLYLTGRETEKIIINGENFYCYEIEEVAQEVYDVEPTFVAACGVLDEETATEKLVIFFVPTESGQTDLANVISSIRSRIALHFGITPFQVIPIMKGDFPKTTSGKIQRGLFKEKFEGGEFRETNKQVDIALSNQNTVLNWFFQERWVRKNIPPHEQFQEEGVFLLVALDEKIGHDLYEQFLRSGKNCILAIAGEGLTQKQEYVYSFDLASVEQYYLLWSECQKQGILISRVHYLLMSDDQESVGLDSLLAFVQFLDRHHEEFIETKEIYLLTKNVHMVSENDIPAIEVAPVLGFFRTIPQELTWLLARHIDIDTDDVQFIVSMLLNEVESITLDGEVTYRQGKRFVRSLEKVIPSISPSSQLSFVQNGLYLITGGGGDIGINIAKFLQENYGARILLIGRTEFEGLKKEKQLLLSNLAKEGHLLYMACNIQKRDQLLTAVEEARRIFSSEFTGVLHLAGIYDEKRIQDESPAHLRYIMGPKVEGAKNLHEVFQDVPNVHFLYFSSVNGTFGGRNVAAYAAANTFLDLFSQWQRRACGIRSQSLVWSIWDSLGMSKELPTFFAHSKGFKLIQPEEGIRSLLVAASAETNSLIIGLDSNIPLIYSQMITNSRPLSRLVAFYTVNSDGEIALDLENVYVHDMFGVRSRCIGYLVDELPYQEDGLPDLGILNALRSQMCLKKIETKTEREVAVIWKEVLRIENLFASNHFFEDGGNSLLATQYIYRLSNHFSCEIRIQDLFNAPTIEKMAAHIDQLQKKKLNTRQVEITYPLIQVDRSTVHVPFALTEIQQAYWVGRKLQWNLGGVATHFYMELELRDIDFERVNDSLQILIRRHDMLRAVFTQDGEQVILNDVPAYMIKYQDLRHISKAEADLEWKRIRQSCSQQLLDFSVWPLFDIRATILKDDVTILHVDIDLLIADMWSIHKLMHEWHLIYQCNESLMPPPIELSFRDYVEAEKRLKITSAYQRAKNYWLDRIEDLPSGPQLPLARNVMKVSKAAPHRRTIRLEPEVWLKLQSIAKVYSLTDSGVLLAAFSVVLARWSEERNFTLNITLFNRPPIHEQIQDIIGDFTSTLLLEVHADMNETFSKFAEALQRQLWKDLDHREYNGVELLREIAKRENNSGNVMMPVVFTSALGFERMGLDSSVFELFGKQVYSVTQTSQVWLDHSVLVKDGWLELNWDSAEEIFYDGMLDAMFEAYRSILLLLAEGALWNTQPWGILPDSELIIQKAANDTDGPINEELLHTRFLALALQDGAVPAVYTSYRSITRYELFQRSNQVGRWLVEHGAQPNQLVAIIMEKGWEQVVAAYGVLLSGAAYLPIDPTLPEERLHYMLENGGVECVLTQSHLRGRINFPIGLKVLDVDQCNWAESNEPVLESRQSVDDLAYVIYTSGSTGLPKGVMIDHRGAVNTIIDMNGRFEITDQDRIFAISELHFDLSVYDIFGALAAGAAVVIPDADGSKDPTHWVQLMRETGVTIWNSVPQLAQMMVEYVKSYSESVPEALRLVMLSGDWIHLSLPGQLQEIWKDIQVVSLGGATEASIWSIYNRVNEVFPQWKSIPYGKPLKNQKFHVLNENYHPQPIWVPGDLYISGVGLAQGYWRDDEKSARSFIVHPFSQERLYKTGDIGRYHSDGNIEFLGRRDFQVKINGYRIELGEIESTLLQHPAIERAIVIAEGEDLISKRLSAYLLLKQTAPTVLEVKRFLLKRLPSYMVPVSYWKLIRIPLTKNGKVNQSELSKVAIELSQHIDSKAMPQNPTETILKRIFGSLMKEDDLDIHRNFFEMGANSVILVQAHAKIESEWKCTVPITTLFQHPSIRELAAVIEGAQQVNAQTSELKERLELKKAFQQRKRNMVNRRE